MAKPLVLPDAQSALFQATKTPWSLEPFVHMTEGKITQLDDVEHMFNLYRNHTRQK